MVETATLSKVLQVRENEKKIVQKSYNNAMESFEKVATELYHLLKKKEETEALYDQYIQTGSQIERIKQLIDYLDQLNEQIIAVQTQVQLARNNMESKQHQLTDAFVEVKKFEKMIEHRKSDDVAKIKKKEDNFMDEISMFQYLSRKNR